MFYKHRRKYNHEIYPDEILLDSYNLPHFDRHQFEGRIEKPISKTIYIFFIVVFVFIVGVFGWRLFVLQVIDGEKFASVAANNYLQHIQIFSERGVIFDRNGLELVWNQPFKKSNKPFAERKYTNSEGLAHVLGYIQYPSKDRAGFYYQKKAIGKEGLERAYEETISGTNGLEIVEKDARGEVVSQGVIRGSKDGANLTLSIDARVQEKMYEFLKKHANDGEFVGGAGVVIDVRSGELLVLTSFPEYVSEVLSLGEDSARIQKMVGDNRKPFLNRAISGLYTPGSIVKPIVALGALKEGVITPEKNILSTGSISVPNPYFPDKKSVFKDWKAHGWVDMRRAIAVSSNVYFYEVGGGYKDQKGLGITKLVSYFEQFGFGRKTNIDLLGERSGIVPTPDWKRKTFNDSWRIGDTYNTTIGQYGFEITPLQAAVATAAIANGGTLLEPRVVKKVQNNKGFPSLFSRLGGKLRQREKILIPEEYFSIVREGMRLAVTDGTAIALRYLPVPVAAKTGTAEVGAGKKRINSWVIGFFPYEEPRYAFSVVLERGSSNNLTSAVHVMRELLGWMAVETPEYLES